MSLQSISYSEWTFSKQNLNFFNNLINDAVVVVVAVAAVA